MGVAVGAATGARILVGLVVCFSGQIGSGKSSVSRSLASWFGWPRAAFGDYLRKEAERTGLDATNREALQDLGQKLVSFDAHAFCRAVLMDGGLVQGGNLFVDGVRHVKIRNIIATLANPSLTKLIYLSAGDTKRLDRASQRTDGSSDFVRAASHIVESELRDELPAIADALIDAERPFDDVVGDCRSTICSWLIDSR